MTETKSLGLLIDQLENTYASTRESTTVIARAIENAIEYGLPMSAIPELIKSFETGLTNGVKDEEITKVSEEDSEGEVLPLQLLIDHLENVYFDTREDVTNITQAMKSAIEAGLPVSAVPDLIKVFEIGLRVGARVSEISRQLEQEVEIASSSNSLLIERENILAKFTSQLGEVENMTEEISNTARFYFGDVIKTALQNQGYDV